MGETHQYAPPAAHHAYADVWLDGEKVFTTEPTEPRNKEIADDVEPILGKTYLPRKFKPPSSSHPTTMWTSIPMI